MKKTYSGVCCHGIAKFIDIHHLTTKLSLSRGRRSALSGEAEPCGGKMQISKATPYGLAHHQVFVRFVKKSKLSMFSCSISKKNFCKKKLMSNQ